jgi:hypothetical protein
MKVKYLFNDQMYLISNHAVAANPIFRNEYFCQRFLEKIEFYLSELCKIHYYIFDDNQFQILLSLSSRERFCAYYRDKKGNAHLNKSSVPPSNYIFSQAMANLQSSLAIHFNRSQGRTGALFARRYSKRLIGSELEYNCIFNKMVLMEKHHSCKAEWDNKYLTEDRSEWRHRVKECVEWCAYLYYRHEAAKIKWPSCFKRMNKSELQDQFSKSQLIEIPAHLKRQKFSFTIPNLSNSS